MRGGEWSGGDDDIAGERKPKRKRAGRGMGHGLVGSLGPTGKGAVKGGWGR